jgi:enoyl-CoA hydratase/carnithine racemase
MSDAPILFEIKDRIAQITFNRPQNRNSMDRETMPAFIEALNRVSEVEDLRCLIIAGSGKTFCSGADFRSLGIDDNSTVTQEFLLDVYEPFLKVQEISVPVIAALNGHAVGGGFGLALICDMRVASLDSKYGANFARLGIHSGMAVSYMLPRLVGLPLANELLFTGRLIGGKRAAEIGLANYALEKEAVVEKAWDMAREVASCAPEAIRLMKRSMLNNLHWDPREAVEIESLYQTRTFAMEDSREGIRALLEKREPDFKGQ